MRVTIESRPRSESVSSGIASTQGRQVIINIGATALLRAPSRHRPLSSNSSNNINRPLLPLHHHHHPSCRQLVVGASMLLRPGMTAATPLSHLIIRQYMHMQTESETGKGKGSSSSAPALPRCGLHRATTTSAHLLPKATAIASPAQPPHQHTGSDPPRTTEQRAGRAIAGQHRPSRGTVATRGEEQRGCLRLPYHSLVPIPLALALLLLFHTPTQACATKDWIVREDPGAQAQHPPARRRGGIDGAGARGREESERGIATISTRPEAQREGTLGIHRPRGSTTTAESAATSDEAATGERWTTTLSARERLRCSIINNALQRAIWQQQTSGDAARSSRAARRRSSHSPGVAHPRATWALPRLLRRRPLLGLRHHQLREASRGRRGLEASSRRRGMLVGEERRGAILSKAVGSQLAS